MLKMKTLTIGDKTYQVWDPEAARIDDAAVGENVWSSKQLLDRLCPGFTKTGPAVNCCPPEGYPLEVISTITRPTRQLTLHRCGENLFDITRLLVSNGSDRWAVDEEGAYYGKPRVLYDNYHASVGGFLTGGFKENTRYAIRTETKCPTEKNGTVMFYVDYTDGTSECILMPRDNTDYTVSVGVTAANKTVSRLSLSLNHNSVTYVRAISLCEGNTARELPYRGAAATVELTKEVTAGSYNWTTGELIDENGEVTRYPAERIPGWEGVNTLWCGEGNICVSGRRDIRSILEKADIE